MVGVPRSKGCRTCRRKKIKCDEQRPRCGQCRKGVRECEGYDHHTIFRNSFAGNFTTTPNSQRQAIIQIDSQPVRDDALADAHEAHRDKQLALKKRPAKERAHPYAIARLKRAQAQLAGATPLPRTLDAQVWAVECIMGQFLEICKPLSESQEAPLAWLGEIKEWERDIDALPLAMSALALGWAGHIDNQQQLASKGLQLYNAALQQLRKDMSTYSPLQSLVVTTIFVVFELCQFGSKGNPGWLTHMKGIAAFLQELGPDKVSSDPYLKVYSFCRVIFIMQGLNRRRAVCASSNLWKHGPFIHHEKNAYHRFYDLSSEACELLGYADDLEQLHDTGSEQSARVLHSLLDLISRLKIWMHDSEIVGFSGPFSFPDNDAVNRHQLDRSTARGYPTKSPLDSGWTPEVLYGQRMTHNYWTLRLDLYMTILDNPILYSLLMTSSEFRTLLLTDLALEPTEAELPPFVLIFEECRRLANNIAIYATSSASHSMYQTFGSLVTVYTLETAIRWYERHKSGDYQMDAELEQHCRAVLSGIQVEESKDPCAFEVSVLPDEVLRRPWC
ncbi:hypothetical protein F5B22DRAFT_136210 [Xylaria bambusicola]|uniref:uncharacterized protein n=1 Tax=Xylaria bambusicola TaxID=326684 RepID=UPI002007B495|nr:uncharacterized protein F5B22DRAFT_136210 [Xylaria bambusicola]KAI0516884.1 hypothetical protein F5B22DRAFT_136210 [Xylaria bambusicola]